MPRPLQPWLFSRPLDLLAFGGSALLGLALVGWGAWQGRLWDPLPLGVWLALVVGVDVAHVNSTWLRTYLDPAEVRRHPARYLLTPILAWALGASLHAFGSFAFWRVLAYLAVFHFIRQQVGWMALYQRLEPGLGAWDRRLDRATTYAATLWPLLWWHAHLPRRFSWFVAGDFAGPITAGLARAALPLYLGLLAAFVLRQLWRWRREGFLPVGKSLVVATTALTWWLGIVALDSDLAFTALNVLPHGVPYAVLVWHRTAAEDRAAGAARALLKAGPGVALVVVLAVALGEEWAWDLGIWHDHPDLFGQGFDLGPMAQALVVPLLALPQATHYLLDGMIWKREPET
jgi:hypothetical protein